MKYYSVIGDSISTFENTMPEGYALYYDRDTQEINEIRSFRDMWWSIVGDALDARLLVNGSWSGCTVVGAFPGACSVKRVGDLQKNGQSPDYILVYVGINDCGTCAEMQRKSPDAPDDSGFASAYRLMLRRLKTAYPDAVVFCATVMHTRLVGDDAWDLTENVGRHNLPDYNREIRAAVRAYDCRLVDLAATGRRYDALDGVHPTAKGHKEIASAWTEYIKEA